MVEEPSHQRLTSTADKQTIAGIITVYLLVYYITHDQSLFVAFNVFLRTAVP